MKVSIFRLSELFRPLIITCFLVVMVGTGMAASKVHESTERLKEADELRANSDHRSSFEIYKEIAGSYRADMSKEEKQICLKALYGCIDDALALADYIAASRYLVLAEEIRDSENIDDDRLELFYSCMYTAMSGQSGNDNMFAKGYPHALKAFDYAVKTGDVHAMELSFFHLIGYVKNLNMKGGYEKMDSVNIVFQKHIPDKLSREVFGRYYKATKSEYLTNDPAQAALEYDTILSLLPTDPKNSRKRATFMIYAARPRIKAGLQPLAEKDLLRAIALADSMNQSEYKLISYVYLQQLYENVGNNKLAEEYKRKQVLLEDSISSFSIAGDIYALDDIKQEKHMHREISLARYRSRVFQWVTVFVVALLVVVIVFLLVLRCKNESLTERARILRQLLREHTANKASEQSEPKAKYVGSTLTDEEKQKIAQDIREVLDSEAVYSTDFSLAVLAEKVGKSPRQVSQVINELFNTNFSSMVNRKHIFEACRRMDSPKYAYWSVEGIAESVGYTQRNTFSTNFKKYTGMGIREYRKLSEEEARKLLSSDE